MTTTTVLAEDGFLSVPEAARFLSVGKSFLYEEMRIGRLPYAHFGKNRRIPRRALVEYAASKIVD